MAGGSQRHGKGHFWRAGASCHRASGRGYDLASLPCAVAIPAPLTIVSVPSSAFLHCPRRQCVASPPQFHLSLSSSFRNITLQILRTAYSSLSPAHPTPAAFPPSLQTTTMSTIVSPRPRRASFEPIQPLERPPPLLSPPIYLSTDIPRVSLLHSHPLSRAYRVFSVHRHV